VEVSPTKKRRAPWAEAQAQQIRSRFAVGDDVERLVDLATSHLAEGTYDDYGSKWTQFQRFCDEHDRIALPATTETVALYMVDLEKRMRNGKPAIHPSSIQPYLSAINRMHVDALGVACGPAMGHLLTQIKHGWEHARGDEPPETKDIRVGIPADVAMRAVKAALELDMEKVLSLDASEGVKLRSLLAIGLGFLVVARADTDTNMKFGDISWNDDNLLLMLRQEKGKNRNKSRRLLTFPAQRLGDIIQMLERWKLLKQKLNAGNSDSFWALPGDSGGSASSKMTGWIVNGFSVLGEAPPMGFSWSSHSLRKGAASAMNAIGVPLDTICSIGGWSIKSAAVHDYIDPTVRPSEGARFFFGWIIN